MKDKNTENTHKKKVSFADQETLIPIPRDGEEKVESDWKEKVSKNNNYIARKNEILKDILEEDLSFFRMDGELDKEPKNDRKEQLYWLLDDLNISNKLAPSILSDNDTYQSVSGYSKKTKLLYKEGEIFNSEEVREMFDQIAQWKNQDLEREGKTANFENGEEYLKYIRRSALNSLKEEFSQDRSLL